MIDVLCFVVGLVIGGTAAWFWASSRARVSAASDLMEAQARASSAEAVAEQLRIQTERAQAELESLRKSIDAERIARTEAETRLAEAARNFEEQKRLLDDAKAKLADAFKALSGEALKSNNQAFLELARKALEAVVAEARGDISKRQEAIDGLIKPLSESLKRYEEQIRQLENSRQKAYGSLEEQLKSLAGTQQQLQKETGNLVNALRAPQVRGRWGEMQLRRVVELAGMSEHCDYEEQRSVDTEHGRLRPDMIVHLPANRDIVVDAKVALDAYLQAVSAETQEQRAEFLRRHAQQLRKHMDELAAKSYWEQFKQAPEMVVMFIPGESFFAAAVDRDHTLIEDGMRKRVVLATPTTLLALLRAVAYGWRQEQIAENAREISDVGRQLYERLRTLAEHFEEMGKALRKTNDAYNRTIASMESRVFSAARRFKELGAATGEEIPVVGPVDIQPRLLDAPHDASSA